MSCLRDVRKRTAGGPSRPGRLKMKLARPGAQAGHAFGRPTGSRSRRVGRGREREQGARRGPPPCRTGASIGVARAERFALCCTGEPDHFGVIGAASLDLSSHSLQASFTAKRTCRDSAHPPRDVPAATRPPAMSDCMHGFFGVNTCGPVASRVARPLGLPGKDGRASFSNLPFRHERALSTHNDRAYTASIQRCLNR